MTKHQVNSAGHSQEHGFLNIKFYPQLNTYLNLQEKESDGLTLLS